MKNEKKENASQEVQRKLYIMLNLSTPIYFSRKEHRPKSLKQKKKRLRQSSNKIIWRRLFTYFALRRFAPCPHFQSRSPIRMFVHIIKCCEVHGAVKSAANTLQVIWWASTHRPTLTILHSCKVRCKSANIGFNVDHFIIVHVREPVKWNASRPTPTRLLAISKPKRMKEKEI